MPEPKISLVEVILIGIIFFIFDLIEVLLVVFALDDFWILDSISALIFFYLLLKGIPPMRQGIAWLLELIPWLGALPLLSFGWALTVWADRHPDSTIAQSGEVLSSVGGKGLASKSLGRMERAEERASEWKRRAEAGGLGGRTRYLSTPEESLEESFIPSRMSQIEERRQEEKEEGSEEEMVELNKEEEGDYIPPQSLEELEQSLSKGVTPEEVDATRKKVLRNEMGGARAQEVKLDDKKNEIDLRKSL